MNNSGQNSQQGGWDTGININNNLNVKEGNWNTGNNNINSNFGINSGNNSWNTQGNNNNFNDLAPEFRNNVTSPYVINNYSYADENAYQIFSDNQIPPKHNINNDTLNTPWWRSMTYSKNSLFFTHSGNDMFAFDLNTKKWLKLNNSSNQFFPKYHRITELPDASFMMHGGEVNGSSVTNSFHFYNNIFSPRENMNFARKAHGHVYCKGFVYVFGGFDNNGTINNVERYDMNNGGWTNLAPMIIPKAYVSCCRFSEEYIFLIGGFSSQDNDGVMEQEAIDRYDIKNNTFCTFKVKLPVASYGFACSMISNDEVLIAGGFNNRTGNSSKVFVADLGKAFIKNLPDLPTPGWTIFPVFYRDGSFYMFFQGEETADEGLPDLVIYNTTIGL